MDSEEFRRILARSGVGICDMIEAAIRVAGSDYGDELRRRRDGIVELLYAQFCRNCGGDVNEDGDQDHRFSHRNDFNAHNNTSDDVDNDKHNRDGNKEFEFKRNSNLKEDYSSSPSTPQSNNRNFSGEEGEDLDPFGGLFDDEQTKILNIREQLEDPHLSEDAVVGLLQTLADMDITFAALEETDIGRHVNQLRKHPSNEVRSLVKMLVRKWKETVADWVKVTEPQKTTNLIADVDSPLRNTPKNQQNGHHQVSHSRYSPNPQNGSSSERNYAEPEMKPKPPVSAPRREPPSKPPQSVPKSVSATHNRPQRGPTMDDERLNSARKRLQENYQEAQNAKKQRTIQVMDIHEIPKPKKGFIAKNKGGPQGRHHW